MSSAFLSVDVEQCRQAGHRFEITGSGKTPMKRHLICRDCSERTGKSAYAAYGDETKSCGEWRQSKVHVEAPDE